MIAASGRELFYHTWEKIGSTRYYEVDFLISQKDVGREENLLLKPFYSVFNMI